MANQYLLNERPITFYPKLAVILGNVNKALIFQQLHFLLNSTKQNKNQYNLIEGVWYVYNSYAQWQTEHLEWLSERSIQRLFLELEQEGLVISKQSVKNKSDRRKWYTINYEVFNKLTQDHDDKLASSIVPNWHDGYSDTTTETTKDSVTQSVTLENAVPDDTHHHEQPTPTPAREKPQPTRTKRGKDKAYSEACSFRASLATHEQALFDSVHFALMKVQYSLDSHEIDMANNATHRRYQKSAYKIVHQLMTSGYDVNSDLITAFGQWYKLTYPNAAMVKAIDKTCEHIDQFIQEHTAMQIRLAEQAKTAPAPRRELSEDEKAELRRKRQEARAEFLGTRHYDFGENE